ncbi:MAG: phosphoenolpyruvate carboxykinase [Tenericutes bacterium HGW-Tenericutes-2]|jgi:energy-coupling factor transporter ATP-binding protein EcfA2|nr:MAG: phosphoenolpyruvate carboxykinase [Tenericutes bacterium HGW-Tenericutes-2]
MKKFHLTKNYAIINFDASICDSEVKIIQSKSFEAVLVQYVRTLRENKDPIILSLKGIRTSMILDTYKLLLIYDFETVKKKTDTLGELLSKRDEFYVFTEKFYDYWRKLERFGIIQGNKQYIVGAKTHDLISVSDDFNERILYLYRTIAQNLLGHDFNVLRQLPAGVNANLMLVPHRFSFSNDYLSLQNVSFITGLLTRPPFMIYSNSNTRSGIFKEIDHNPLPELVINKLHYIVYPIWVGPLLTFVYVHRDFLHHGVALSNLFEPVAYKDFKDRKPDLLYVYGHKDEKYDGKFYRDKVNDFYIGFVSRNEKNDYFGYLKKMLLTLHNVYMIDHEDLPIHGAMVNVMLKNGDEKNIVIIGDSGAGKSETLEALRTIGGDYIKAMRVVFDDMGTFFLKNKKVFAHGTEIGAFVRLDDLDAGYAYQEMDRAIFLNPDKMNARVILPISYYNFIMKDHKVDMLFYANNYKDTDEGLRFLESKDLALEIFRKGERVAKGTTSEVGLVSSYFANPFGPVQKEKETDKILENFFDILYKEGIPVGEIYTRLAVDGHHMTGPKFAARKLLELLTK